MDARNLIEDLITQNFMSGESSNFIVQLKQTNLTPTEARTSDPFGDPKIGQLVGDIIELQDNMEAYQPKVTELHDYLNQASGAKNPENKSDVEQFSMDENTKKVIEDEVVAKIDEKLGTLDEFKDAAKNVSKVEKKLEKLETGFSRLLDALEAHFSEDEEKDEDEVKEMPVEEEKEEKEVMTSEDSEEDVVVLKIPRDKYDEALNSLNRLEEEFDDYCETSDLVKAINALNEKLDKLISSKEPKEVEASEEEEVVNEKKDEVPAEDKSLELTDEEKKLIEEASNSGATEFSQKVDSTLDVYKYFFG